MGGNHSIFAEHAGGSVSGSKLTFWDNEVRLQLHALAYNLAVFLANVGLPEPMAEWSLTSLQLKLIKIGACVVRHARAITFQLAEVTAIQRLRAPPAAKS